MAIEPINSAMSYQAQQTPIAKPVTKPEAVDIQVAAGEQAASFDPTTAKIVEAKETNTNGQNSGNPNPGTENAEENIEKIQANNEKIKKAVEELNKKMPNSEAVFGIHEATNRVTIKLVDKDSKETIKELPAEETLDMIAKVWEMAGILVDEKR